MLHRTILASTIYLWTLSGFLPVLADDTGPEPANTLPAGNNFFFHYKLKREVLGILEAEDQTPTSVETPTEADADGGLPLLYPMDERQLLASTTARPRLAGQSFRLQGNRRLRLAEVSAQQPLARGSLSVGLIDSTTPLDQSDVINYGTARFASTSLLNNPTTPFPGSALGLFYRRNGVSDQPGLSLMVTSSNALRSNSTDGFCSLFENMLDEKQGVFLAAETFSQPNQYRWRMGAWMNTAKHAVFHRSYEATSNFGAYGVLDADLGPLQWSTRVGMANPEVTAAAWFASSSLIFNLPDATTGGLGYSHTGVSDVLSTQAQNQWLAEAYLRKPIGKRTVFSPSIKYIENPTLGSLVGSSNWIGSLKVSASL